MDPAAMLRGSAKAVVDEARQVLGVTIVGPAAVDHLHAATIAVTAEVTLDQLWQAVPVFPTASEFWLDSCRPTACDARSDRD
jgi:pyruvate/2-oxoglutarate dehydrogenase complex dihydrolipoamide dehydrogenase (E3) component